jgi:CRP-like cAMP-binding protein
MTAVASDMPTTAQPRAVLGRRVWQQLLGATPLLTPSDAQALDALTTQRTLAADEIIFARNTPAQGLVLLIEGTAAVGRSDGTAMVTDHVGHGPTWLDAASAWTAAARHAFDARALSAVRIAELPRAGLQELLLLHPALVPALLAVLAQQVQHLVLQTHELMHQDAASRLAAWLHRQSRGVQTRLHLTQRKRDIAAQLGMSPETLSRQIRQLSCRGLIEVRGYQVRVLDRAGLQHLASA